MPPGVREKIMSLDGWGCVAPALGATDLCRDRYGNLAIRSRWPLAYWLGSLTIDRVKDQPRMGQAAPYDIEHGVTLCWHHHLNGWATAHRPELRAYIIERNRLVVPAG